MIVKTSEKVNLTPMELITNKTLYTLSGASASVWIVCLVIHSIFYKSLSNPEIYKLIALALSLIISLSMVLEQKIKKYKDWFLAVINGFLIFVYATGFNTISANIFISESENKGIKSNSITKEIFNTNKIVQAGFINLLEIKWFPDKKLLETNKQLKYYNDSLNKIVKSIPNTNYPIQNLGNCNAFQNENFKLKERIKFLESLIADKTKNSNDKKGNSDVNKLIDNINNLKNENFRLESQLKTSKTDKQFDSLRQQIIILNNQTKTNNNLGLLKEIEKLKSKLIECMDNKQVH